MTNKNENNILIEEMLSSNITANKALINYLKFELRCAAPAIVKSFDADTQTISAQLVIKERLYVNGEYFYVKVPAIPDVPICVPKAGNFIISMPIKEGDECLLIFCDRCIDNWFGLGGEDNEQKIARKHDLSDCFAIMGIWSQPNKINNYSTSAIEIRTLDGNTSINIKDDEIEIKAPTNISIESSGTMEIKSTGDMNIEGTGNINIESDVMIQASAPIIDITSDGVLNIEGQGAVTVNSSGIVSVTGNQISLANGVQGVARIGDSVDPITHLITGGSSKVLAG